MLTDQLRHELRGMLVHHLRLAPAAAAAMATQLETKNTAATEALMENVRSVENALRGPLGGQIDAILNPPQPAPASEPPAS